MKSFNTKAAVGGAALAAAALAVSVLPGSAQATGTETERHGGTVVRAHLDPLNNSGATGHAKVRSHHRKLKIDVHAHGLTEGMPHAQHIHYGRTARNECPTGPRDDANRDFRLTTIEGVPAYGPVKVSLTKRGSTNSPDDVLAVDRYPTAPRGTVDYDRRTRTSKAVARAIRRGEAVVVIHGVDYNGNGVYDDSAGPSDLDPSLPAEATDPALCGVLRK